MLYFGETAFSTGVLQSHFSRCAGFFFFKISSILYCMFHTSGPFVNGIKFVLSGSAFKPTQRLIMYADIVVTRLFWLTNHVKPFSISFPTLSAPFVNFDLNKCTTFNKKAPAALLHKADPGFKDRDGFTRSTGVDSACGRLQQT